MSQTDLLLGLLKTTRLAMLTAVKAIDNVIALAEQPGEENPSQGCQHPHAMRIPTPSMGHPMRFHCQACNNDIEG